MPQSLTQMYVHIIFGTKYRYPFIKPEIEPELFSFMGGIIKRLNGIPILINGIEEHVHILSTLPKTVSLSKFVEEIKRNSSRWIKTKGLEYVDFKWQVGYAAFSVSKSKTKIVERYIARQKEHHRKQSSENELIGFYNVHGVNYNEQFLRD